ncbi:TRAPP II complex [Kalaharituber pfeilii]|nr:TRAPP II complex [Kalaharituber pfeilii]
MSLDGLSYTAASRMRALLCPIGRIRRSRFLEFVERVQLENIIRLGDIAPDPKPNRTMFSPQGFPNGQIVYNFSTSHDRDHEYLEPFEPHRRTFLVIAIADFTEGNPEEILLAQFEDLRAIYRRALFHTCLIFDSPSSAPLPSPKMRANDDRDTSKFFIPVPTKRESRVTTMRTIMCDITACLLSEFTGYARTLQSLPTIESPLVSGLAEESTPTAPGGSNRLSMPSIAGASVMGGLQQQRMSMQAFGSGTTTERARIRGKGRIQISIAELYLLTGRTTDALKELVEGANVAKNYNDHLWHGKALDGIGICLVILAYLGVDFQIPNIPFPPLDAKAASKSTPTPPKTPTPIEGGSSAPSVDLQQLLELIPEIGNSVLNLFNRSSNFQGESIPQLCFSETVIRYSKFMTATYLANGLNTKSLSNIVISYPLTKPETIEKRAPGLPEKRDISASVMRAYPNPIEALTVLDASKILGGISSVLGSIGFQRKKAMVSRELIRILIPGLIQARVVGAAGAGVHPAAGLSATSGPLVATPRSPSGGLDIMEDEVEIGIMGLLEDMCAAYGILRKEAKAPKDKVTEREKNVGDEIVAENELRAFGWPALKIHVLRSCMSLCEALPDFHGVLKFTAQLLKLGGSDLAKEEQIKLATNISRTISAASKLGLSGVQTSYWDAFLLRDIELVESAIWKSPTPHGRHELVGEEESGGTPVPILSSKNPFIYNPFGKNRDTVIAEQVLVQNELAEFKVTLQNPFDFDVEVESIALDVTGVEFETEKQGVVLSPFRTQQLSIFGKASQPGNMTVVGCKIKVFGCVEQSFPILTEGFDFGKMDIKIKRMGLSVLEAKLHRPASAVSKRASGKLAAMQAAPTPKTIPISVVESQPLVVAQASSLPQSALMVLEGERKTFNVVFKNVTAVPVDIIFFSFQDSTTTQLQAALASKDMQPSEIYEYEILLLKKRALIWKNEKDKASLTSSEDTSTELVGKNDSPILIPPQSTANFDIEVLGKPGLTNASVQMDYGYLGVPKDQIGPKFYTRQAVLPITVTVNASIELVRVDFIPFATSVDFGELSGPVEGEDGAVNEKNEQYRRLIRQAGVRSAPSEYCLMTLDLRNAWPQPLKVTLQVREPPKGTAEEDGDWIDPYETSDTIQAGHQNRFVLLVKRVHLANPTAKIPSLSGSQRQFVVSTSKPTAVQERLSREAFWFREEILKCIRGTWAEVGTARKGEVELRNFRLSPRMVETVRVDDVGIKMEVVPCEEADEDKDALLQKAAPGKFMLETDRFYNLRTTITNRTSREILPILRLSPSLRNQHISAALDLSRRFAFDGLLQQALRRIPPGGATSVEMGFVVLCRGEFEVTAGVEEVRIGRWGMEREQEQRKLGPDGIPEDVLEGVVGRMSWVGREVLTMVVRGGG